MGTRGGLLRPRKFEQSSGQVTLNCIEVTISHFSFGERCGGLIGSLQEPSFKLRRDFERLALLVAHAAKHIIRQFLRPRKRAKRRITTAAMTPLPDVPNYPNFGFLCRRPGATVGQTN
jgi:hypothetical protein